VPAVWAIRRSAPDLRFGFRGARLGLVRQVTTFGFAMSGIQLASVVKLDTDEVVIGVNLPIRDVSPYSIARRLSTLPGQLANQLVRVLLPVASKLDAEQDFGLLRDVFVSGMRNAVALFAAVAGGLIVFAGPFLSWWVGPSFAKSAEIVTLLTLAGLFELLLSPATEMLQGMGRHRPLVAFGLGSAALNLSLSIALIGPLGVRGVAVGTLVATAVEAAVVLPFSARVIGVGRRRMLAQVALPCVLPVVPMVGLLLLLRHTLEPRTLPMIVLCGLAGAAAYVVGYLATPGASSERRWLSASIGSGLARSRVIFARLRER
jgi:O-antigen/teichoic acid export membrane protein